MNKQRRLKEIEKEFVKIGIIDAPGAILVGLGLYAKFTDKKDLFLAILQNDRVVNAMLAVGGMIMIWSVINLIRLAIERQKLDKE